MSRRPELSATHARMQDVAKRASVSAMTVSRALRDPEKVSEETRRRITRAIRDVGYVPNELAGGLRAFSRTKLVAAIVPSVRNSLFAATVQGMSDVLRARGINLMLGDSHYSPEEEEDLINAFLAQRPSGIVLHDKVRSLRARRLLAKAAIPVVEVGDLTRSPLDMCVSYSNFQAGRAMTRHLLDRGRRRIGFASLATSITARSAARLKGYKTALRQAGVPVEAARIVETEGGFASGGAALVQLVDSGADAVFFAGDVLAVGAVLECQRRGWAVPGRVAIASFDDHEIASQVNPALTALRLPRYEIGRRAAELILARLDGVSPRGPVVEDLGFDIIARDST
jgi:LacI family gluconate utilization system Gnt-I transcriptional repressor